MDITQQEILVAVGRGIQQKDNLELAEELAAALGGAVCASRPVIDQGWLPATRQVGKSGMTVKPRCFIALGISGAPEHVEGMKDSDLIFAVNTDPNAPIFDVAHYGVVGDLWTSCPPWWKQSSRNRRTSNADRSPNSLASTAPCGWRSCWRRRTAVFARRMLQLLRVLATGAKGKPPRTTCRCGR